MGVIDFILNLTGLLLWLNWRSIHPASPEKSSPLSLASALKTTNHGRSTRWLSLIGLIAMLVIRSVFYWNIGSVLNWTPNLELGLISLPFRSDYFLRILLFSFLSFSLVLAGFYSWLLLLSSINRRAAIEEPLQRMVRLHLGRIDRWPKSVKLLLPLIVSVLVWGLGSPGLVDMRILPPPASVLHRWEQAVLLGLTSYLAWKFLLAGLCLLYLIHSYVYLGNSLFWSFVNTTGANLLRPLRRLPVRLGKIDFSPVIATVLVLAAANTAGEWLHRLFQRLPF